MAMQSKMGRQTLAAAGPTTAPDVGALYTAPDGCVVRLYVRNDGGADAILAFSAAAVNGPAGLVANADQFPLPSTRDVVFILQPRQAIYAVGAGAGIVLAWTASEALPEGARPAHAMLP